MPPFEGIRGSLLSGPLFSLGLAAVLAGGAIALVLDPQPPLPTTVTKVGPDASFIFASNFDEGHSDERMAPGLDEDGCEIYGWELEQYQPTTRSEFATGRVSFAVRVGEEVIPYPLITIAVMPNERIEIAGVDTRSRRLSAVADRGPVETLGEDRWIWRAPGQQGMYCVRIEDSVTSERICINAFVMRPYDGSEVLNGYRIGEYRTGESSGNPLYAPPRGFIEVTPELENAWVSPHFQLRQFLCKQSSGYPKYLVLRTRLLLKMERLLEDLNDRGIPASSFYVVSGFRTPWYNQQIGNASTYSRHTYGDAVDFLVDVNQDGVFDDIDRDGRTGTEDIFFLQNVVTSMEQRSRRPSLVGGFGVYEPVPGVRGPFAHMDARGSAARWVVRPGEEEEEDSVEVVEEIDSTLIEVIAEDQVQGRTDTAMRPRRIPGKTSPSDTPSVPEAPDRKSTDEDEGLPARKEEPEGPADVSDES